MNHHYWFNALPISTFTCSNTKTQTQSIILLYGKPHSQETMDNPRKRVKIMSMTFFNRKRNIIEKRKRKTQSKRIRHPPITSLQNEQKRTHSNQMAKINTKRKKSPALRTMTLLHPNSYGAQTAWYQELFMSLQP